MPEPDSPGAADPQTYNAFVASISLAAIDVVKLGGERRLPGEASHTRFDLGAAYQIEDDAIRYRYDATGHLTDEADADFGEVTASVIVTVRVPGAPPTACVERFGSTPATMMAHPYLREALAATAQRLGFPGVLLPIVTQQPERDANASAVEPQ